MESQLVCSQVYYVSSMGSKNGTGSLDDPLDKIQTAFDLSLNITTEKEVYIYVLEGNYTEQTLFSEITNKTYTHVIGLRTNGSIYLSNLEVAVKAQDIELKDLVVGDLNLLPDANVALINMMVTNMVLSQDTFANREGILDFKNCTFEGEMVDIVGDHLFMSGCYCRRLLRNHVFVETVEYSNCKFEDNLTYLQIISKETVLIESCNFLYNLGDTVGAVDISGANVTLNNTIFTRNRAFVNDSTPAISLYISNEAIFQNNYFSCNAAGGVIAPPITTRSIFPISFKDCSFDPLCEPQCKLGSISHTRFTQCIQCPAGYYSNSTTATTCDYCKAGQSTNGASGSSRCYDCSQGSAARYNASSNCLKCIPGSYASGVGSIRCKYCEAGTFQPQYGQIGCRPCDSGSISAEGSVECKICGEGTYASDNKCLDCNIWYTSIPGSKECSSPSWRLSALIGGLVGLLVLLIGGCILLRQRRRVGYWAVRNALE
jgi:hypothetical protein